MSEFLAGVVVGVALGVAFSAIGGPLLGAIRARYASNRQDREDERLLRAIRDLSNRDPNLPVAVHEVREMAKDLWLDEGLDRLQYKGHIIRDPDRQDCFAITDEGRRAASEPRPWWRKVFGARG